MGVLLMGRECEGQGQASHQAPKLEELLTILTLSSGVAPLPPPPPQQCCQAPAQGGGMGWEQPQVLQGEGSHGMMVKG